MTDITISIDSNAVSLVLDGAVRKPLGTGFSFIRPNWIVTAKHVVITDGRPRDQLLIGPSNNQPSIPARVLYTHPWVDLAVLEIEKNLCEHPLYPAHHAFAGSRGLICAGFAPSKSTPEAGVMLVNHVPAFTVEVRERQGLDEELVVFDAPYSEGGHSGGPIFGEGGGVVGVVIQNYLENGTLKARGTSLAPLIAELRFPDDDAATGQPRR
jgi:S1-C subfamily serine protease